MAANAKDWTNVSRRLGFAPACFLMADEVTKKLTGADICQACEIVAGPGTMDGCQKLGGLWRLYAKIRKHAMSCSLRELPYVVLLFQCWTATHLQQISQMRNQPLK